MVATTVTAINLSPKTSLFLLLAAVILVIVAIITLLLYFGYRRLKLNALYNINFSRSFSTDGVFVGETLELSETVSNPSWLPLISVKLDFFVPAGITVGENKITEYTKLTSVYNIAPYSTVTKKITVKPDKRGRYQLYNSVTKYRGHEFLFESFAEFYAYPDFFDSNSSNSPDIYESGNTQAKIKFIEDPFFISGIRDYRPGDPMRAINFKASVRSFSGGTRTLLCNNYESSRTYDSMVFLDLNSYTQSAAINPLEQLELGLKHACYIFREAMKNGGSFGFATNRISQGSDYVYIPCGNGEAHIKRILEEFAVIDHYGKRDYSMTAILNSLAFDLPRGVDIYIITSFVDDKTAELLFALEKSGRNVQVVPITEEGKK